MDGDELIGAWPCKTSAYGTVIPKDDQWPKNDWSARNEYGLSSYLTPIGEWTVTKQPGHRFGPVLRLSGFQGWGRGILVHAYTNYKAEGSRGCISLSKAHNWQLFSQVEDGTKLIIKP